VTSRLVRTIGGLFCPFSLALLLGASSLGAAEGQKGHLLIVGGGPHHPAILKKLLDLVGDARILVLPMASETPEEVGRDQVEEFKQLGAVSVSMLNLSRSEADSETALEALRGAKAVFFSGGDQSALTRALKGTRVEMALHRLYREGGVLSGTSAGAAVMSRVMITGDERRATPESPFDRIESDNIITTEGFGFITEAIIDQHFVKRRRHNRLLSLVLENPRLLGIGINEQTAIWVKPGGTFEVIGEGPVIVYDAKGARVAKSSQGHAMSASDVKLQVLGNGSIFDMRSRRVTHLEAR
jgi:cyanophycinase